MRHVVHRGGGDGQGCESAGGNGSDVGSVHGCPSGKEAEGENHAAVVRGAAQAGVHCLGAALDVLTRSGQPVSLLLVPVN